MKLSSLLNPKWSQPQQPMSAPLGDLRRVVFRLDDELLNFAYSQSGGESIELVPRTQLRTLRGSRPAMSRDVFSTLLAGYDECFLGAPSRSLTAALRSIEYHFASGEAYTLAGVSNYEGLPDFLRPKFYVETKSCDWSSALGKIESYLAPWRLAPHLLRSDDLRKLWIIVLEILYWSLARQTEVGDLEVHFTLGTDHVGHRLEELDFSEAFPLAASLGKTPGTSNSVLIQIWQEPEFQLPPRTLVLPSAESLASLESYLLNTTTARNSEGQLILGSIETDSRSLSRSIEKLEQTLGENKVQLLDHSLIRGESFKPSLKVREDESTLQIAVAFDLATRKLRQLNFPANLSTALKAFGSGIDGILSLERKEVASNKKEHRASDLLLLRHQGLALFCLLEVANWMTGHPLTSGEAIPFTPDVESVDFDKQLDRLVHYIHSAVPALLGKSDTPFKQLVSPAVQGALLEYLELLVFSIIGDRAFFIQKDGFIEVRDVYRQALLVIRFLLLHFSETSEGKMLTRAEAPIGERFKQALQPWAEPHVIPEGHMLERLGQMWVDLGHFNKYSISLLFELTLQGCEVELDGVPLGAHEAPFEFKFEIKDPEIEEDVNWFDLHPQVFFEGKRVSMEEVRLNFGQGDVGFIEYQGRLYRIDKKKLPTYKSLQLFWDRLKGQREIEDRPRANLDSYRVPRSFALELLSLRELGVDVKVDGQWKAVFDYFENGLGVEKIQLPEQIKASLLPHQIEGAQWLYDLFQLRLGGILADEMGLGKTFQTLSFLSSLYARKEARATLIVVPTSLVYNWLDEKKRFAPDLPFVIYASRDQLALSERLDLGEPLVVIATYGQLAESPDYFRTFNWDVVVFDEAQYLKNIKARRSEAARDLPARFKICLTGTPMENNHLEFFALCDLVVPGALGDIDTFRKRYVNHEARPESIARLRTIIKPLVLRRTKEQVQLSLPVKTVMDTKLPFKDEQKDIYKKLAMTFSRQVDDLIEVQGERQTQFAMFSALMRLRQVCSDPSAIPGIAYHEMPVKIEHVRDSIRDHLENQESVIVFTQFLSTLNRLEREMRKADIPTYVIHGGVTARERQRTIAAFQNRSEPAVIIMTLKTGGVGLNLTKASVVYHLEPWWNPAVEAQATDRAHRMGQTKDVRVFNLLIEGSLEEKIQDLKLKKQASFDQLFGNQEAIEEEGTKSTGALTREDFQHLLK